MLITGFFFVVRQRIKFVDISANKERPHLHSAGSARAEKTSYKPKPPSYSQPLQGRSILEYPLRQGGQGVAIQGPFGVGAGRRAQRRHVISHQITVRERQRSSLAKKNAQMTLKDTSKDYSLPPRDKLGMTLMETQRKQGLILPSPNGWHEWVDALRQCHFRPPPTEEGNVLWEP